MKIALQRQYIMWRWSGLTGLRMQVSMRPLLYWAGMLTAVIVLNELLQLVSADRSYRRWGLMATILGSGAAQYYCCIYMAQLEYEKSRSLLTRLERKLVKRDFKFFRRLTYAFLGFLSVVALGVLTIIIRAH